MLATARMTNGSATQANSSFRIQRCALNARRDDNETLTESEGRIRDDARAAPPAAQNRRSHP